MGRFGYCRDCRNNDDTQKCMICYRGSWFEQNDRDDDDE